MIKKIMIANLAIRIGTNLVGLGITMQNSMNIRKVYSIKQTVQVIRQGKINKKEYENNEL